MKKRSLLLVLAACLTCLVFALTGCNNQTPSENKPSEENPQPTSSITYEKNGDAYTVTGAGDDAAIVIPAEYEGLPVTAIGESAFSYARHKGDITSVTIPDSVTAIGRNAFNNRSELVTVNIGTNSRLASIGANAFSGNSSLKSIYLPATLTEIGDSAFNNCGALDTITVAAGNAVYSSEGNCLIEIATHTLIRGTNSTQIPASVTEIADSAFRRATTIKTLVIPKTVTKIGNYIIADSSITTVNYGGTEAEWDEVEKTDKWNYGNRDVALNYSSSVSQPTIESGDGILLVYFSYSGTTERVANELANQLDMDAIEIVPATAYTSADTDYTNINSRNRQELANDLRPEVSSITYNAIEMSDYGTVIIGYPIWNGYEPMIIRTFIEHYGNLQGKTVYTFSTSASSAGSTAHNGIKTRYTGADVKSNLHFTSSTISNMQTRITSWIEQNHMKDTKLYLTVNGRTLTATLAENTSTAALKELLASGPLTIDMSDYSNFEKVGEIGAALPRNDEQITTEAGDLILYLGSRFVIYYDTNS